MVAEDVEKGPSVIWNSHLRPVDRDHKPVRSASGLPPVLFPHVVSVPQSPAADESVPYDQ